MKLDIVLRTHDGSNVHDFSERYCGESKQSVVLKCATSLSNSIKLLKDIQVEVTILDDGSTQDTLDKLDIIFKNCEHPYNIINLKNDTEMRRYNYSALKQWEACRNSDSDLVYSVEDDYLHCPSAITEMVETYKKISNEMQNKEICISPLDYTNDYMDRTEICQVGWGSHRHWKTGTHTTNTFMTTPSVFQKYWEPFYKLATEYYHRYWEMEEQVNEHTTINNVWANAVPRLSPLPGLALHMQFEEQNDPMIDWKYWWENYTQLS
jgi:hypothetical protein